MFAVNYLAVVVSLAVYTVLGMLWYGPLFGKSFIRLAGLDGVDMSSKEMKQSMTTGYVASLVSSFVALLTLAMMMRLAGITGALDGLLFGALAAFGLIAMSLVGEAAWHRTPWSLVALNSGYRIVGLSIGGLIIGVW